jgi:CheY-like chemotaxis protein
MSEDTKPPRAGESAEGGSPRLDAVARRIEELSLAVLEQTERLLERSDSSPRTQGESLASILDAARRSSELARELVLLARRERDAATTALARGTVTPPAPSERVVESVPAVSLRRVRGEGQRVILLVEDEPLLLKTMRRMLEQYGHRVLASSSAVEALAHATAERAIDLVVTDLALPGMPGSELVKRLRASRPGLRVLYTSGWDPLSSGVHLATDGSEAFLSKPFTAVELDAILSEMLGTPALLAVRGG